MTNQQGAPEALTVVAPTKAQIIEGLRAVQSSIGWRRPHILDQPECTHWDYIDAACAALVEAQQPAPSAAAAEIVELLECSGCLKVGQKDRALAIVARLLPAQHGGVL